MLCNQQKTGGHLSVGLHLFSPPSARAVILIVSIFAWLNRFDDLSHGGKRRQSEELHFSSEQDGGGRGRGGRGGSEAECVLNV